mmetsp:Transcript_6795/g.25353  ORF Transcript_6795/g.25353 Transcript_6795/m.25353 type:complete len:547 (+) Transcript_6795:2512-4152(+)
MNIFGIVILSILCVVAPIVSVTCAIFFLSLFQADEDKGYDPQDPDFRDRWRHLPKRVFYYCKTATLPKIIFIIAFSLVIMSMALMPIDVANARYLIGFDFAIAIIWQVYYALVLVFVIIILPFSIFYYEAEDPDSTGIRGVLLQARWGCCFTCCLAILVVIVVGASYPFLGFVQVPYDSHISSYTTNTYTPGQAFPTAVSSSYQIGSEDFQTFISFVIYIVALVALVGYVVLVCCGGCGMWALPIGCCKAFKDNFAPGRLKSSEFITQKLSVQQRAQKMMEVGQKLQELQEEGKLGAKHITLFQNFRQATYQLQHDWEVIHKHFQPGGYVSGNIGGKAIGKVTVVQNSVIMPFCYLAFGIIATLVTLIWIAHIIVFLAIEPIPGVGWSWGGLNIIFSYLDYPTSGFPIIGGFLYLVFMAHLMLAVIAGAALVTSKIPLFAVHPIKFHDTMLNSLLFNVGLFLLASVTVNQFCVKAFRQYASDTAMEAIFGASIRYMIFIKYFYIAFVYIFLVFIFLGLIASILLFLFGARPKKAEEFQKSLKSLGL